MFGEKKDVEVLGGKDQAAAAKDERDDKDDELSEGPQTGEDAPLFDPDAAIGSKIGLEDGQLVIAFSKNTKAWDLARGEVRFATALMIAYVDEMRVVRRGKADADGADADYGAKISIKQGCVRVAFDGNLKKFRIASKNAARRFIRHLRADAAALPPRKTSS